MLLDPEALGVAGGEEGMLEAVGSSAGVGEAVEEGEARAGGEALGAPGEALPRARDAEAEAVAG